MLKVFSCRHVFLSYFTLIMACVALTGCGKSEPAAANAPAPSTPSATPTDAQGKAGSTPTPPADGTAKPGVDTGDQPADPAMRNK